jgi:hypothetical protein
MAHLLHRPLGRKHHFTRDRLEFVGLRGFRRRVRWGRPFVVRVFRVARFEMGVR